MPASAPPAAAAAAPGPAAIGPATPARRLSPKPPRGCYHLPAVLA